MIGHGLSCSLSRMGKDSRRRGMRRQRGAIAILFVMILVVLVGIIGLSIDVSRMYNRKVELQSVADAAALSGADSLAGTADGIDAAVLAAKAAGLVKKFGYERTTISWSDSAVLFSTAPSGQPWVPAADARLNPLKMLYIKVDTGALTGAGDVNTIFMQVVAPTVGDAYTSASAVAGRSHVSVTPLGICALSTQPATSRTNCSGTNPELIQYGFRRGVGYDLMQLNPNGSTPENFVLNPIDDPSTSQTASNLQYRVVGPYVCSGTMPFGNVVGAAVAVGRPFPLATLYKQLNSRFDQYEDGVCDRHAAPPDINVKPFVFSTAGWMVQPPDGQTAAMTGEPDVLRTVADKDPGPAGTTAPMYGLLWSYAQPVPICNTSAASLPEPEAGYPPFERSLWPSLYSPGNPAPNGTYPATTPYLSNTASTFQAPSAGNGPGVARRRVLHVPLLRCPISAGTAATARVLAIGRFFMTVPATATSVKAEFAGIEPHTRLLGTVELYR